MNQMHQSLKYVLLVDLHMESNDISSDGWSGCVWQVVVYMDIEWH